MENQICIRNHCLFETGVFEKHPGLFDVYAHYTADGTGGSFHEQLRSLRRYERDVTWPVIKGPGFCGATNPGAGKSFNGILTGISNPVYNSDSLYVNPGLGIFAVSDSPGISPLSRDLFEELDHRLKQESIENLEKIIHELGFGIDANRQATLSLICFRKASEGERGNRARIFIAGDTGVYSGNTDEEKLVRLSGVDHFWGTAHRHFRPVQIEVKKGDFFLIASDGIDALNRFANGGGIEKSLLAYIKQDPENFAYNVTASCNGVFREMSNGRNKTVLGGYDDITTLLVFPHQLIDSDHQGYIFGGNVW